MEIYLYLNGAQRGPFSEEQVRRSLVDGFLQPSDLASGTDEGGWKPVATLLEGEATPPSSEIVAPSVPAQPLATLAAPIVVPQSLPAAPDLPALQPDALGPYSRSTLTHNEKPYFKTSLHWIVFARFAALAFALFLFAAIPFAIGLQAFTGWEIGWFALPLPALILLPPTLAFASSELVITDRRVLIKTGIIRRQTVEMFISKVESIAIDQGVFGRMFDYGNVTVRGTGGFEELFEAIASPVQFRTWVQRLQSDEARL